MQILLLIGILIGIAGLAIEPTLSLLFATITFSLLMWHSIRIKKLTNKNQQLEEELDSLKKESQSFQQLTSKQLTHLGRQLFTIEKATATATATTKAEQTTPEPEPVTATEAKPATITPPITSYKPIEQPIVLQTAKETPQPIVTAASKPALDTNEPTPQVVVDKPISKPPVIDNQITTKTPPASPAAPVVKETAKPQPVEQPVNRHHKQWQEDNQETVIDNLINKAWQWLLGGNTILRVGAIILFLGLAFLLRYATEGMTFPIEGRYIAVAIGGFILIGLGWRLRNAANNYGLILQGTGIAVLYLTSYAAMYLHHLLPANTVFVFLIIVTALAALLAIIQDALSLAIAAALGGFAAPILASSEGGNHVALFSYFILLNAGILSIAWFKAWRPLNLIGFVGTFGIGFAWGIRSYTPELLWSTEPFLIIFFIMYIAIGLLFARRKLYDAKQAPDGRNELLQWSIRQTDYIDASVLFGTPIVGFGLQYALVNHIAYAVAISAFVLGIFYLIQAFIFYKFGSKRITLLAETCLALGVIFTSLTIPLAFNADWTSASWALEGAGIYWVSLRQQRKIGRFFAILLQFAASLSFLSQLTVGTDTLLAGSSLGAVLLSIGLLFSFYQATKHHEHLTEFEQSLVPLFAIVGVSFIYLLAPLHLMQQGSAIYWVIAGIITLLVANKINYPILLNCGLVIQLLACIVFASSISTQQLGSAINSDYGQFISCLLFGLLLLANSLFIIKYNPQQYSQLVLYKINSLLLFGLVFINFSFLFVLSWLWVAGLWVISGFVTALVAIRYKLILPFIVGLALQVVAALIFVIKSIAIATTLTPFFNIYFAIPLLISLAGLIIAYRIQRPTALDIAEQTIQLLARLLLIWGLCWWAIAFAIEIIRISNTDWQANLLLLTTAISLLVAGIIAKRYQWSDLALATTLLIPIAVTLLSNDFVTPFSHLGWLIWGLVFAVHLFNLKQLTTLLPKAIVSVCHIIGLWLFILVLSCGLYQLVNLTHTRDNTWYWLLWIVIPSCWLFVINYKANLPWPIKEYYKEYSFTASLPLAILVFAWFWLANSFSTGTVASIPYIPLLNPLELGLLAALAGSIGWLYKQQHELPITLSNHFIPMVIGVSLFALSTAIVFRAAFHWANVPFQFEAQIHSMAVQASLSILWTSIALALMIFGHKKVYRSLWLIGATLIAVVVIKLFFVELSNSGSLERIISFTIVGVLLLIVGYFAPLPPKQKELQESEQS